VPERGRRKLFESREIAECIWMKGAPNAGKAAMWARYVLFQKARRPSADCFFKAAGSGNLTSQLFQLPQQISLVTVVCRF
jgi:hypothetical protein